MSFKKQNLKKTNNIVSSFIGIVAVCIVIIIGIVVIKNLDVLKFDVTKTNLTPEEKVTLEEKKEEKRKEIRNSGKINILLVWRWGWSHDAPDLTDTLILASLDKEKHLVSMVSIPRDLYVDYGDNKWGKINWIYAKDYYKTESKEKWMDALSQKVIEITGEKVDYFINIDFNWFTKVVDALGWIEITVPDNFVDDKYPDNNWGYKTLVFRKWTWNFNGDNALKYARSRHSTSDFDRSLRQQQVISGVKKKIIEMKYLTSASKIKEFYWIYNKYIYTDIWITDLLSFLPVMKDTDKLKMLSYNINDSCFYGSNTCEKWGFLYIPERVLYNGMSVLLMEGTHKEKLSDYGLFQKYANRIYNHQEFFLENTKINVFNSLKINNLAWALSNDIVRYWFNIPKYNSIWNTPIVYPKSVIYYNNLDIDSETIKFLKIFFKWDFIKTDFPKYSKQTDTKIEIVIWEDYLKNKQNVFDF